MKLSLQVAATGTVSFCWAAFWAFQVLIYLRSERGRRREAGSSSPSHRDRSSMGGLVLEALGFAVVFSFPQPPSTEASAVFLLAAIALAPMSCLLAALAARQLGRQFRIQAIVTDDHRLVTEGPYRLVRHPIYASLLGLLLATGFVWTRWPALAAAVVLYLAGTEIRVRAEDRLLAARFGHEFDAYRRRVPAYIPFVR